MSYGTIVFLGQNLGVKGFSPSWEGLFFFEGLWRAKYREIAQTHSKCSLNVLKPSKSDSTYNFRLGLWFFRNTVEFVLAFLETFRNFGGKVDFISLSTSDYESRDVFIEYGIRVVATFIIEDSEGNVLFRSSGKAENRVFQPRLEEVLTSNNTN